MKPWVGSMCLLACGVTSFVAPNSMRNFKDSSRLRQTRMKCWSTSSEDHTGPRDENSSTGPNHKVPSVPDMEQLLGSFNRSSPPEMTSDAAGSRHQDLDETRLLLALRRQLGDEDFYTIFDPRNPVIGEF